jgi:PAS domain S-box-containing protein
MSKPLRVLVVEDSEDDLLLTIHALRKGGYEPTYERVEDAGAMRKALETGSWDVILCDYQMPKFDGLAAIALLKETGIDIPLIIVSGAIGEETAVECMRIGARDYFMKGNLRRLAAAVERELNEAESRRQRRLAEEFLRKSEENYRHLFDNSPAGIYQIDFRTGKFLKANDVICKYFGCRQEEVTSLSPYDVLTDDSKQLFSERLRKMGLGEKVTSDPEYEIVDKNGKHRWLQLNSKNIYDTQGLAVGADVVAHEITDRKRLEEVLHKSEQKYRLLVENTSEAIVVVQDGRARFVNRGIEWAGYTPEEYMSIPVMETIHPEDREAVEQRYLKKINGDKIPTRHTYRGLDKSGQIHWIEVSSVLIDWEGRPATLNLIADITERKRMEENLSDAMQHLTAHIDNSPLAVVEFDPQFRVIRWSRGAEAVFGWTSKEITGKAISEIRWVYEEDKELVRRESACLLSSERRRSLNVNRNYRRDGSVICCEWYNSGIYDSHGKLISILSQVLDITKRKKTEETLRESEEKHRILLEESSDPIFSFTPEGEYRYVNRAFAKGVGKPVEEIIGKRIWDVFPKEEADKRFASLKQVFRTGEEKIIEARVPRSDGDRYYMTTITPIKDTMGEVISAICSSKEITELKQAEKQLQGTLESLRKAVGTTIQVMVSAVETRDPYTSGHQLRSADLALAIAMEMGLPQDKIEGIRMAGSIHDIGKLSIPAEILSKPTKLSEIEFSLIKEHACKGFEMLKGVESPWPLAEIVHQHHERMDGSGYPRNLKGNDILIEARILSVADVVEAMASHRPYRPGLGIDLALAEIEKNRGICYDDAVADACLRLFREKGFKLEGI